MWVGHYLNGPLRQLLRDGERLSRPWLFGRHGFGRSPCDESYERIKSLFRMIVAAPLALSTTPLSLVSFSFAYMVLGNRLEVIDQGAMAVTARKKKLSILSLNGCFQESMTSPVFGGVVYPFAPAGNYSTRVAALAHWVASKKPDIFLGQEFTDLYAQDAFIADMKKQGFRFFIVDRAPHPFFLNSGLFIASKYKLQNPSFISIPLEDRYGSCRFVQKGALSCEVATKTGLLFKIINTHLNAETDERSKSTRYNQLRTYIIPLFGAKDAPPTILAGDFNFDTSSPDARLASGLEGYTNIFESHVTWTSEGIQHLRGGSGPHEMQSIDVMIANSPKLTFSNRKVVKAVKEKGVLLTDHYAISASVSLKAL